MDLDELVDHWTLLKDERELVAGKRGPTRLGFALLLKFYARAGRFPRGRAAVIARVGTGQKRPRARPVPSTARDYAVPPTRQTFACYGTGSRTGRQERGRVLSGS